VQMVVQTGTSKLDKLHLKGYNVNKNGDGNND